MAFLLGKYYANAEELFYMGRHLVLTKQKIEEMKKAGRGQGDLAQ